METNPHPIGVSRTSAESTSQFEKRKQDHIDLALKASNQATGLSGLDQIQLQHTCLPEIDLQDVTLNSNILGEERRSPFFVCGMTAGHRDGQQINQILAEACENSGWILGVGSQRRQLFDRSSESEWVSVRKKAPNAFIIANLGLSQLVETETDDVKRLVESLNANALVIHTNPMQESIQPEGTPFFRGGLRALERLVQSNFAPILFKETGCGISREMAQVLSKTGVKAVDVSGLGGTHWGRIEGDRAPIDSHFQRAAQTFANWGISTVDSVLNCVDSSAEFEIWASGGVRTGLDAAKLLTLGANAVGLAKPVLEAALKGVESVEHFMSVVEYETRVALFCTGCESIQQLRSRQPWKKI
ncbi:MAG: type 2 isopentenyl-diphosphate Delta-isomerase [Bdellovibrionales bacterium]|nr:type 2 isopentenyl-diphosphate Delta-isomerase [Bdellovibrionales bacterium]